jgi:HEAT repeat protein
VRADPPTGPPGTGRAPPDRRLAAVLAGHRGDPAGARAALADPQARVRAAGLGALARLGALRAADLRAGLADPDPVVRRRAAGLAPGLRGAGGPTARALVTAVGDPDPLVAEAACTALGELARTGRVDRVGPLSAAVRDHPDARVREAALGALGSLGDPAGLPAVLDALSDRPTVRRRAAVALSAFDGPEVEAALRRALEDRDWQVREVAEILLDAPVTGPATRPRRDG